MFRNLPSTYRSGIRSSLKMGHHGDDHCDDPIVHLHLRGIL